jgi:hypothetical protein
MQAPEFGRAVSYFGRSSEFSHLALTAQEHPRVALSNVQNIYFDLVGVRQAWAAVQRTSDARGPQWQAT